MTETTQTPEVSQIEDPSSEDPKIQELTQEDRDATVPEDTVDDTTTEVVDQETEQAPKEEDTTAKEPEKDTGPTTEELLKQANDEIAELRAMVRDLATDQNKIATDQAEDRKVLEEADVLPAKEETKEDNTAQLMATIRDQQLDTILETMRLNPDYKDVDTVVSQANFDKFVDKTTNQYIQEEGGNFREIRPQIEAWIWAQPNPYKLVYDATTAKEPEPEQKKDPEPEQKKEVKPAETAPSLQAIPGGTPTEAGGWTSAKIDAMISDGNEEALDKVPSNIRELYLQNKLK